jgi:hypothetical protein
MQKAVSPARVIKLFEKDLPARVLVGFDLLI